MAVAEEGPGCGTEGGGMRDDRDIAAGEEHVEDAVDSVQEVALGVDVGGSGAERDGEFADVDVDAGLGGAACDGGEGDDGWAAAGAFEEGAAAPGAVADGETERAEKGVVEGATESDAALADAAGPGVDVEEGLPAGPEEDVAAASVAVGKAAAVAFVVAEVEVVAVPLVAIMVADDAVEALAAVVVVVASSAVETVAVEAAVVVAAAVVEVVAAVVELVAAELAAAALTVVLDFVVGPVAELEAADVAVVEELVEVAIAVEQAHVVAVEAADFVVLLGEDGAAVLAPAGGAEEDNVELLLVEDAVVTPADDEENAADAAVGDEANVVGAAESGVASVLEVRHECEGEPELDEEVDAEEVGEVASAPAEDGQGDVEGNDMAAAVGDGKEDTGAAGEDSEEPPGDAVALEADGDTSAAVAADVGGDSETDKAVAVQDKCVGEDSGIALLLPIAAAVLDEDVSDDRNGEDIPEVDAISRMVPAYCVQRRLQLAAVPFFPGGASSQPCALSPCVSPARAESWTGRSSCPSHT